MGGAIVGGVIGGVVGGPVGVFAGLKIGAVAAVAGKGDRHCILTIWYSMVRRDSWSSWWRVAWIQALQATA